VIGSDGLTERTLNAAWLTRGPLPRLLGVLDRDGEEARVIGGAVRNELLGLHVHEFDVATTALPEDVSRRVAAAGFKAVPTGIEHGTVTVVVEGQPFEVTTLRRDVETYGRHAKVEFGRDWRGDAHRRDFTINAFSVSRDGTVYDYVGGLADLESRRVRFIGDPRERIREDYLRILRFFRFHAAYGHNHPDSDGLAACIAERDGLDQLSRERVRMELMKLLVTPGAVPTLIVMADAGLLLRTLGGVPYLGPFARMVEIEAALGESPDPVRRLGALGVSVIEDAERLWHKLRLTNAEHARLSAMGETWHRMSPETGEHDARALLYRLKPQAFSDSARLAWARSLADAGDSKWRTFATLSERWTMPGFPLKAADFIARGMTPGPALGAAMRAAEQAWIAADFPEAQDALTAIRDAAAISASK
jgi:poly(A) polymerase